MIKAKNRRTFLTDVRDLYRSIEVETGGQAEIEFVNDDTVGVILKPKDGFNAHAHFRLLVRFENITFICSDYRVSKIPSIMPGTAI